jgi:hypothetical protein
MTSNYTVSTETHDLGGGYVAFTAHVTDNSTGHVVYSTGRRENDQAAEQQAEQHIRRLTRATA